MKRHRLSLIAALLVRDAALAFTSPSRRASASALARPRSRPGASASALSVAMLDGGVDTIAAANDDGSAESELALLLPGQTLRIRIGDVSSSRKAWKKRRRNSSPILIPCSVLGMNREWMVRWNVMTLLHMVGEESSSAGGAAGRSVGATAGKIGREYRKRLGGDLKEHAAALGYDSVDSLLKSLFDERIQAEYGVSTSVEPRHDNLVLTTNLTRRQARSFSSAAGMVQFRPENPEDGYELEGNSKMIHTGMASVRLSSSVGKKRMPKFTMEPLGAALRVSPYDEAAERFQEGDELNAFVYSYDTQGDNESPLLVLTADDPRGRGGSGTFGSSTRKRRNSGGGDLVEDASIERELNDLSAGDGPYDATVVAVSGHSNAAFVDCGVGRKRGKKYGGGTTKVLGMLRFEDIVSGDATTITEEDLDIKAGDEVKVYVRSVSPQSGRFMVTLDPSIKEKKPVDLKREKQADKRKERLEKQVSHDEIESLIGSVYDGIVKAKSKAGNWYYVQPTCEEDETCDAGDYALPVGVASFSSEDGDDDGGEHGSYSAGDRVRVRLEGVDEKRGQLALTLL